jgi:hypothetical protein
LLLQIAAGVRISCQAHSIVAEAELGDKLNMVNLCCGLTLATYTNMRFTQVVKCAFKPIGFTDVIAQLASQDGRA